MIISDFYKELVNRNKLLAYTGLAHLVLFIIFLLLSFIDHRLVLGIDTWIKPMKFALSIWLYLWTAGWYLSYLLNSARWIRLISRSISLAMIIEMACITLQAARGVRSHFNIATPFDAAVFSTTGFFIGFNTLMVVAMIFLFFTKKTNLSPVYLLGIRLGLLLFFLASAVGGVMIGHHGHSIGSPDGSAGLPFVNWSTIGGDLRVSHFIGIHALQILPFFAFIIEKNKVNHKMLVFGLVAFFYTTVVIFLFWQAWTGTPLLSSN